jgi:bacillolysin
MSQSNHPITRSSNQQIVALCVALAGSGILAGRAEAQMRPAAVAANRVNSDELRAWDQQIDQMLRARDLRVRETQKDALVAGRQHERLDQYHHGVRIFGGDVTRQFAADGTVSAFGVLHTGLDIDVTPRLSVEAARQAIAAAASGEFFGADAELVVLPLPDGYHLAYYGQAIASAGLEIVNVFVDADTGALLRQYGDYMHEGVIGTGTGTYGDTKKVSATTQSGAFVANDSLRPAAITTYDMKGDLTRTLQILNLQTAVTASDIATSPGNVWTDSTVVDAHVYAGWYYDYLVKRFGRNGLNGNNLRMAVFTHPVRLEDIGTASNALVGLYYLNAFFCSTCGPDGRGAIVFGAGAPKGYIAPNVEVKPFSAAFDVVAHELTHGVTASSARLNGYPFSDAGALNEGFSDMFGASTAFFYEPIGTAPLTASYSLGRDLAVPAGALLIRSLSDPRTTRNADHYTQRIIGSDPHYNSTIASHAFYLAIEGGANRTSGLAVQGVGAANREQIEKAFFRALTVLLPSNATLALTRAATIQSARDLYGAGSNAERAITQAWDAVGVQDRIAPTATMLPNPASSTAAPCGGLQPSWNLGVTVSAGSSNLRFTQWVWDTFDHNGALEEHDTLSPVDFSQFFRSCGPGSTTLLAQTDACSSVCVSFQDPEINRSTQITFTAVDDAGRTVTFATPRVTLR